MDENKKSRGLGRGLSELLGEARAKAAMAKQVQNDLDQNVKNQNKQNIQNDLNHKLSTLQENTQNENDKIQQDQLHDLTIRNDDIDDRDLSLAPINEEFEELKKSIQEKLPSSKEESATENENINKKEISIINENISKKENAIVNENISKEEEKNHTIGKFNEAQKTNIEEDIDEKKIIKERVSKIRNRSTKDLRNSNVKVYNETEIKDDSINQNLNAVHKIPIELINPNRQQPRKVFDETALKDLAESIKIYGVIQPILVNKFDNEYQIVAGERRWRASQIAGLKTIPAIIVEYDPYETLEVALIENIQRSDLTPLDEAKAYYHLLHHYELTQNELAHKLGKSRSYIANMVRLIDLDDSVKTYLENGDLTVGHARLLIGVENADKIAKKIVESQMSVRGAASYIQSGTKIGGFSSKNLENNKDTDILALEADLRAALDMRVKIDTKSKQTGSLTISYKSLDQLDEVCNRLCLNKGHDDL